MRAVTPHPPLAVLLGLLVLASMPASALAAPVAPSRGQDGQAAVEILARSNRADLVSGGQVLLEIVPPETDGLVVTAGERDVSEAFAVRPDGRLLGIVEGLTVGTTEVTAAYPDGHGATLEVTNHPVGGPIFAGEQVEPWPCATQDHELDPATDEQCNAETVHTFFYLPEGGDGFEPYDPDDPPPDEEVARTTTDEGHERRFIVRRERGVLDRGIYDIAVLHDPDQPWDRYAPQEGWNGKLHWPFGGSCQPYHGQNGPGARPDLGGAPGVLDDPDVLGRGFAVATSAFSVLGNNCNTVVSAEALMMIKEHLVEDYGDIRHTLSTGGSGGSIQQLQIAGAYPGLLDGIIPDATFPDILTTATENLECRLLVHYFTRTSPHLWPPAQQSLVTGHGSLSTCHAWISVYGFPAMLAAPTLGCTVPLLTYNENDVWGTQGYVGEADWVYHPTDNPDGVRCTVFDYMEAVLGTSTETGFANRPFDNVGVQYGLEALLAGEITAVQFLDLNANLGGLTPDYTFQPERSVAEEEGLRRAYASGQATVGGELDLVPIIDGSFAVPHGDIHTAFHAFSLHERLLAANGQADNHVIRQAGGGPPAFDLMDAWLTALAADEGEGTRAERVVATKPDEAQPSGDYLGTNPRIDAGAPLADDVLKCQLVQPERTDYDAMPVPLTDAQWEQLQAIFPDGVCDFSRPSVGFTETVPWATYAGGEGPVPLGEAPRSVPFAAQPAPLVVERFGGADRVATAAALSAGTRPSADVVVLARADEFADALAGGPLAAALGAPLLLTDPAVLSAATAAEIARLGASRVVVLGGSAAVSPAVVEALSAGGLGVRRVAGTDRFATAAAIAAEVGTAGGVLLAAGGDFADAVAASAVGSVAGMPVLLTDGPALPPPTREVLARPPEGDAPEQDAPYAVVAGGPAAVPSSVVEEVRGLVGSVTVVAGTSRLETSVLLADLAIDRGASPATVWLASGHDFPDALAAAPAVAADGGVLLLVDGLSTDPQPALAWLSAHAGEVARVRLGGGTAVLSEAFAALVGG